MSKLRHECKKQGSTYRVYIEDTDLMGIVYHANYLCFFERARTDLLRDNGISLTTMATYDTYFAIHDIQLRYVYPARVDDDLQIITRYERKKTCSVVFDQSMHNHLGQLLCEARVHVVCVNRELKPKRWPDNLLFNK